MRTLKCRYFSGFPYFTYVLKNIGEYTYVLERILFLFLTYIFLMAYTLLTVIRYYAFRFHSITFEYYSGILKIPVGVLPEKNT